MSSAESDLFGGYCSDCTLKWINNKDPYDIYGDHQTYFRHKE